MARAPRGMEVEELTKQIMKPPTRSRRAVWRCTVCRWSAGKVEQERKTERHYGREAPPRASRREQYGGNLARSRSASPSAVAEAEPAAEPEPFEEPTNISETLIRFRDMINSGLHLKAKIQALT